MSRRRRGLEEQSYWPGYVDALTNVVLNLLFMVGIFAIGIFSMSMEAALKPKSAQVADAPEALEAPQAEVAEASSAAGETAVIAQGQGRGTAQEQGTAAGSRHAAASEAPAARREAEAGVSVPLTLRVAGDESDKQPPAGELGRRLRFGEVEGRALTRVIFAKSEFAMSDESRAQIAERLRSAPAAGRWTLWTTVDAKDGQDRREGYLRVMTVRSALMSMGVPADSIDARIFVGSARGEADSRRVTLLVNGSTTLTN
jgi:hypothetical protein